MLKGKDPYYFVRFGGLDLKTQKGFGEETFHAPPASRGFYAMPKLGQDWFLLSNLRSTQPYVFHKRDKLPYNESNIRARQIFREIRKEFRKDEGTVWHHLEGYCKRSEILNTHLGWVKTDMKTWARAFAKASIIWRAETMRDGFTRSGLFGPFSKDTLEVFFDEKI
jgi:hypothetical protein